jgi:hypothetical protein
MRSHEEWGKERLELVEIAGIPQINILARHGVDGLILRRNRRRRVHGLFRSDRGGGSLDLTLPSRGQ